MRSSAARYESDIDDMHAFEPQRDIPRATRPRRPAGAPAVRGGKRSLWLRGFLAVVRRPGRSLLILAGGALVASVMVNALFLQNGRHPAPLFAAPVSSSASPAASSRPSPPVSFSAPPARSASVEKAEPEPFFAPSSTPPAQRSATPQPEVRPAPTPAPKPAPARAESVDAIGALLRGGAPQTPAPLSASDPVQAKRIVAAQRALEKLGFQVSADGLLGPGTRTAIQKFEREGDLPVTGDLNPRTLRALAARSGVSIP